MTDKQFAERLGRPKDRPTWTAIRNRRMRMRVQWAQAAAREFPDLIPDVLFFVLPGVTLETIREQIEARQKSA